MARESTGEITITTLTDGTNAYQLRFRDKGRRERITLHERPNCDCGCGGGWNSNGRRTGGRGPRIARAALYE
jgi:hypothetical protein